MTGPVWLSEISYVARSTEPTRYMRPPDVPTSSSAPSAIAEIEVILPARDCPGRAPNRGSEAASRNRRMPQGARIATESSDAARESLRGPDRFGDLLPLQVVALQLLQLAIARTRED
jgi:hypothetical protein